MITLDELIARADRLATESKLLAEDLRAYKALQASPARPALKHADGRLTEQGVRVLHAALDGGKSPSEVARMLDITVPAVLYRRDTAAKRRKAR
ncbi:MAG: hypothetical protein ACREEW_01320 [Caulobacteraceae bacterium]